HMLDANEASRAGEMSSSAPAPSGLLPWCRGCLSFCDAAVPWSSSDAGSVASERESGAEEGSLECKSRSVERKSTPAAAAAAAAAAVTEDRDSSTKGVQVKARMGGGDEERRAPDRVAWGDGVGGRVCSKNYWDWGE